MSGSWCIYSDEIQSKQNAWLHRQTWGSFVEILSNEFQTEGGNKIKILPKVFKSCLYLSSKNIGNIE